MALLDKYVRTKFDSYEDFYENYQVNVPENFNFAYDVVDELARTNPDKLAMLWVHPDGTEKRFTFADMKLFSDKAANVFAKAGIGKGDMVMLILKRHYQFWFCMCALHKLGAVAIPATHLLTVKDIVYRNNAADVKMIVSTADGEVADFVDASQAQSPSLKAKALVGGAREGWLDFDAELHSASDMFARPTGAAAAQNSDYMLLYFTSGTTGQPKMVAHDFLYPLGHITTAKFWHQVKEDGLHFTIADTGWGKAVWGKLYGQWLSEGAVLTYDFDKFDPADILEKIQKYRVTTFCVPPTMYRYFIKQKLEDYDLSSLVHCTVAGEPLNPEVYNQFLQRVGLKLHEGFGQTETTASLATYSWMEPRPGAMGKPTPGYAVSVLDENGNECRCGEVGEICIHTGKGKPVGMFSGYYRDEALTKSVWHDDVYHTGDVAWRDEDGFYWYVGRADDVIKSSGYRIGPFEVESVLLEHPAVLEAAVTGVPDEDRGAIVKATVVLTAGYTPSEQLIKELQTHVKKTTAPYKYPRVIEFVDKLPKTISGKIRRVELRK